jgi:hypothetical protein
MAAVRSRSRSESYWSLTRSPLHCLIFLLPLLILYELGLFWLAGSQANELRNGADHWMRGWLQEQGWDFPWLLPVLVIGTLFAWQLIGHFSWQIRVDTLVGMAAESLLFACVLLLLGQLQETVFQQYATRLDMAIPPPGAIGSQWCQTVSYMGAGVYEEVLFRLLALPLVFVCLRLLMVPDRWAMVAAVFVTSVMFSLAHYVGTHGDTFSYFSFIFRMIAGCLFAILFVLRGFGVTVGSHAAYDVLVGVVLCAPA